MSESNLTYTAKAKDIFIRARMNAFAHKNAFRRYEKKARNFSIFGTFATVIPFFYISLTLNIGQTQSTAGLLKILGVIAVLFNALSFGLGLLEDKLGYSQKKTLHENALRVYSQIAQKIRRLDGQVPDDEEAKFLCRHLQETFEIEKSRGIEPSEGDFEIAKKTFPKMDVFPFGIDPKKDLTSLVKQT